MPQNKGGLGLHKTDAVNKAFQCKLAWKVLSNESNFWTQSIKTKYLKDKHLFDYKRKGTDLPVQKSILNCKDLLRRGITWKLGSGDRILFQFDNWVGNFNLVETLNIPGTNVPYQK